MSHRLVQMVLVMGIFNFNPRLERAGDNSLRDEDLSGPVNEFKFQEGGGMVVMGMRLVEPCYVV
jgi:hypothetical protein